MAGNCHALNTMTQHEQTMKHTLPKAIRAAVNRNAFRIAMTDGYEGLRKDLERLAQTLMNQPHATAGEVVAALDGNHIMQTAARPVQRR